MRICHLIDLLRFDMGGPVRAVIDLSEAFQRRGHNVSVLTFDTQDAPDDWATPETINPVRPTAVRLPPPAFGPLLSPGQLKALEPTIRETDVLHLHGVWLPAAMQIAARAHKLGTPYVISIRGMLDEWSMQQKAAKKKLYLALAGSKMLRRASAIHTTAEAELDQASNYFPRAIGRVIPNFIDLAPYRDLPPTDIAEEAFPQLRTDAARLLFLSRIHVKKGAELLIDATAALAEDASVPPFHVFVAGTGDQAYVEAIRQRVSDRGVSDRVTFVGHVNGDTKLSLYSACDLFVLPTSQENFGFVFFESLAAGTPVLTTRAVDTWRELEASGGGHVIDRDLGQLIASLRELLPKRDAFAAEGQSGREWVFSNLSEDSVLDQFEAMYRDVTADGAAS